MFESRLRTFSVALLVAARLVLGQTDPCSDPSACSYDYGCLCAQCQDLVQCLVCGYQGSEPMQCMAYNNTFDDMKSKTAVGTYQEATWASLYVVTHGPNNPIIPSSCNNMGRSTTGSFVLNYVDGLQESPPNVGGLYSFDFACAVPTTKTSSKAATSRTLSVTANCVFLNQTADTPYVPAFEYSEKFSYTAPTSGLRKVQMTSIKWDSSVGDVMGASSSEEYLPWLCYNYTFSATMADGTAPFLYLDNVVGNYEKTSS